MKYARLFKENEEPILVSADDVRNGLYDRHDEFVDPEYEFRVQFVKGSRNNGGPYFRLYYSYEEYKELYPERASRYEIVAKMRRYKESQWHSKWKKIMGDFCSVEKCIKNKETGKWKFADAYYERTNTVIEFQHSYISFDFEERNEFYEQLSITTIWLYDLSSANVCEDEEGNEQILEDNANGFFRISENPENLKKHRVYIQTKSGEIYRVNELLRCDSSTKHKSTIRYFVPSEIYSEEEFVSAIKSNTIATSADVERPSLLKNLWKKEFRWMIVKNTESGEEIFINRNQKGEMYRDFKTDCIQYTYADNKYGIRSQKEKKQYSLSAQKENSRIWVLIRYKIENETKKRRNSLK
ncbi:MAG: hypothetical protein J6Q68_05155 [Clostridia bacterium]|nr:hypothetical protein [Clostridia bacterium]